MTAAIWGTLAALTLALGAVMWFTMYTPETAGTHRRPSLRQRLHERNQAEQARQQHPERIFVHPRAGTSQARAALDAIAGKADDWAMPAIDAEVAGKVAAGVRADLAEVAHEPVLPALDDDLIRLGWTPEKWYSPDWGQSIIGKPMWVGGPCGPEPEPDDLAAATPEQEADAYVGDPGPAGLPAPVDQPGPLFDRDADHWREDTLLGMPAVK